jgi:Ca2+-binding EF-hand superfamily protein
MLARSHRWLAAAALALAFAMPASAAPDFRPAFDRLDADHDGQLTADEFANGVGAANAQRLTFRTMQRRTPGAPAKPPTLILLPPETGPAPIRQSATYQTFDQTQPLTIELLRRRVFTAMDADADGKVSFADYQARQIDLLTNGFARLDRDSDGVLSAEEYGRLGASIMTWPTDIDTRYPATVQVGAAVSDAAVAARFTQLDADGDAKITLAEYIG